MLGPHRSECSETWHTCARRRAGELARSLSDAAARRGRKKSSAEQNCWPTARVSRLIEKIAKRTLHVSNARGRLFGRAADAPSFKYRPLAANLWRERTVTFGSRGRRPEVASTANAQPLPIPAAGAPAAPGNSRKSAGEGAAPEAPGNSPSKLLPPPPVKPEWTPKPRRPSRPAAPSSPSSRPSPRRGP